MKKIINHIFELNRFFKISVQLMFDGFLIIFSFMISWYLRLDEQFYIYKNEIITYLILLLPFTLLIFFKLGFYKNIVRFISITFIKYAFLGSFVSALIIYLISISLNLYLPRSIPLIYLLVLLITICGIRFQLSFLYYFYLNKKRKRIGIIGASKNGIKLAGVLSQDDENHLVAFFDDKKTIIGSTIRGITVYKFELIEKVVLQKKIDTLLIANSNISKKLNENLLNYIQNFQIEVKKAPNFNNFTNFYSSLKLKDISIKDILGRKQIKADPVLLHKDIKDKIILVTGAGGSIGSELCLQILKIQPKKIILYEQSEFNLYKINFELNGLQTKLNSRVKIIPVLGSIQDENQLVRVFSSNKIDTVYHAAAYKHVPLIELNIFEGIKNNIFGTKILIDTTVKYNTSKFILISSDKAVRPKNFMGATKRAAEILCLLNNKKKVKTIFSIVRFGNVLESSGSVVPLFKKQITKGGPVTVTDPKIERYFMTIQEAAELVIQAGSMAKNNGEIFILDMGKRVKVLKLAEQMIKLNGSIPILENSKSSDSDPNSIIIKFTGLRPGEKLIEELVYKTKILKTRHPRILKTKDNLEFNNDVEKKILNLLNFCKKNDLEKTIKLLIKLDSTFDNLPKKI